MRRFPQIRNLRSRWSTRIMRQVDFCWTSGCVKKKWIDAKEASNQFQLFFHRAGIPSLRQVLSMKSWKMDDQEKWPPNFWVPPLTRRKLLQPPPLGNARPPPFSLFFSQADSHTRMHHTLARLTLSLFLAHKHLHIHTHYSHTHALTLVQHTRSNKQTHTISLSLSLALTHSPMLPISAWKTSISLCLAHFLLRRLSDAVTWRIFCVADSELPTLRDNTKKWPTREQI